MQRSLTHTSKSFWPRSFILGSSELPGGVFGYSGVGHAGFLDSEVYELQKKLLALHALVNSMAGVRQPPTKEEHNVIFNFTP